MPELMEARQLSVTSSASSSKSHVSVDIFRSNPSVMPYYSAPDITLYRGDAAEILSSLEEHSVDCVVTSPPYYGQRDYGHEDQLGLEGHPQCYIDKLVAIFQQVKRILKPTGNLWVNIGDTYWSGKGRSHGIDSKQRNRRFTRPQDKAGERPWCAPKQLLLIPHRFAIAMQEEGWIVRNDNVWYKPAPTPDPVKDRCALVHEYVFHFVKQRKYYFDTTAVAIPSNGRRPTKTPPSVWTVPTTPSRKLHKAVFPEQLVSLPLRATCPPGGVFLDPFCGSATALSAALAQNRAIRVIGIDLNEDALKEATTLLSPHRGKEISYSELSDNGLS